jgi:outer membrane protein OmpA-like peptidoglycan-associated protein
MKKQRAWAGLWIGMVLFLFVQTASAKTQNYNGPDDSNAVAAANVAVKALGSSRGAIPFKGNFVEIIGLKGIQVKGLSVAVEKMLTDLGAKKVGERIQVSLSGDVLFNFDKWDIKKGAEKTLFKLAKAVKSLKTKEILIEGHTDSKGSDEYNLALSQRRADSVKTWLVEKGGLSGANIATKGYGESKPVAPNTKPDGSDDPEGRAKNRRVEIYVTLEGGA